MHHIWPKRGLRVKLDLNEHDYLKNTSKYVLHPSTFFLVKTPFLEGFRLKKPTHSCNTYFFKNKVIFCQKFIVHMHLEKFEWLSSSEELFKKTLHLKMTHWCEAFKTMLSNFFCTAQVCFGKSVAYKSKYTLKPLLSQNMEHLLEERSQRLTPRFTSSTELKSNSRLKRIQYSDLKFS